MIFFFFSSRRRHTRLVSDWSSDVCSSDLGYSAHDRLVHAGAQLGIPFAFDKRSEERRVGKECRSRWSAHDEKKKTVEPRRAVPEEEKCRESNVLGNRQFNASE